MYATFTCEQCFQEYDDEQKFVRCHGDACSEIVCINCATKCKDPSCKKHICDQCLKYSSSKQYCGPYCIEHAIWSTDEDGECHNFDYVKEGMSHKEGLAFLEKFPDGSGIKA